MNINKMANIYNEKKEIHFKLYSLEYTIKQDGEFIVIFCDSYPEKINKYKTFTDLLNNYTVYNESIMSSENRIENIK